MVIKSYFVRSPRIAVMAPTVSSRNFSADRMVVKVAESNFPELMSWLQQYLPESYVPYQELKNHVRGKCPNFDYYVDRWPDPQAVAAVPDPIGKEHKDFMLNAVFGMFGVTDAAMTKVLKDSRVVDWSKIFNLHYVPERLLPVIKRLAEEMQVSPTLEKYFLLKATPHEMQKVPVPEGMKMVPVSMDHINAIDSTWKYSAEGTAAYIKKRVSYFPSVLLMTDCGQHVGHMVGTFHGMGILYVFPEFRRNGYAKVLISQLSQKYFDTGEDAYVVIEEDNQPSITLHESLGFKTLQNFWAARGL